MSKLKIFILSILTTLSIYSEFILKEMIIVYEKINKFEIKNLIKFSYSNTTFFLLLMLTIALIIFYNKFKDLKTYKAYNILSLVFSFFLVFGFSYSIVGSSALVTGNIILVIISLIKYYCYYSFLKVLLNLVLKCLQELDLNKIKIPNIFHKFVSYYEKHPYKTIIITILIAWSPYIISFYPGILSPDPSNQIKQYFGLPTHYIEGVNLIDKNVLITNHHPIFHTAILGGFAKIGYDMGSINIGLFMFTTFQLFLVISAITYLLVYLKKLGVPLIFQFVTLILFALVPVFPLYAMSSVKDTFFGALLVFYLIELHKLLTNQKYDLINYITLGLLILFMMLVRNNGIYMILFSFPILLFLLKDKRKMLALTLFLSIFGYECHNKILLPVMHITNGSIRETLSIPFQQTARYAKYYPDDINSEEKKIIDKILNYETLASRYKPNISDPVKNEFNKDTTTQDLIKYFQVWFKCFLRHPGVYFDATINTVYGYFYPNTSNWYLYYNYDKRLIESNLNYHYNNLSFIRNTLSSIGVSYPYIPVLGSLVNIGFVVWVYFYLLCLFIVLHKKRFITLLMPALALVLILVAGPVNTYFRYVFPLVLSLPLILGITYKEIKVKNKS